MYRKFGMQQLARQAKPDLSCHLFGMREIC